MLTGHSLVYYAPGEWDDLWRNRHQLMSVFARDNKVLFVERRLHLRPTLTGFRHGALGLSDLSRSPLRQISENLFVFRYPVWAPISGRTPLRQLTRTIRRLAIQSALRTLQMSQPIVWLSRPDMADLSDEIASTRLLLYHVVDEYTAYHDQTEADRHRIEEREKAIMAQADAVIVVSKELYKAKRLFSANTYLVPNGVDCQAYTVALADSYLPDDLRVIPEPRLGYSGLIGHRLNLNVLKELAQENPEWSLVLLGEARFSQQAEAWQALRALPNVYHLGPVEISQVPHYVKGFQVGLMPYVQDRHAEHISPLKLYDYLAAGLPVVATDIPAVREFSSYVHLVDDPQGFAKAVRSALADATPERRQARSKVAARHTWEARVEQLSSVIETQLAAKASRCP